MFSAHEQSSPSPWMSVCYAAHRQTGDLWDEPGCQCGLSTEGGVGPLPGRWAPAVLGSVREERHGVTGPGVLEMSGRCGGRCVPPSVKAACTLSPCRSYDCSMPRWYVQPESPRPSPIKPRCGAVIQARHTPYRYHCHLTRKFNSYRSYVTPGCAGAIRSGLPHHLKGWARAKMAALPPLYSPVQGFSALGWSLTPDLHFDWLVLGCNGPQCIC